MGDSKMGWSDVMRDMFERATRTVDEEERARALLPLTDRALILMRSDRLTVKKLGKLADWDTDVLQYLSEVGPRDVPRFDSSELRELRHKAREATVLAVERELDERNGHPSKKGAKKSTRRRGAGSTREQASTREDEDRDASIERDARPYLQLKTGDGKTLEPTEDQIMEAVAALRLDSNSFVILEAASPNGGATYMQAARRPRGFVLEHREGSPRTHEHTYVADRGRLEAYLFCWAVDNDMWKYGTEWFPGPEPA
jgi:hypothetical protein